MIGVNHYPTETDPTTNPFVSYPLPSSHCSINQYKQRTEREVIIPFCFPFLKEVSIYGKILDPLLFWKKQRLLYPPSR